MAERAVEPAPSGQITTIVDNLARVVHAPDETLRLPVPLFLPRGGKPSPRKRPPPPPACPFPRLQFTPDLLPSDVTGVNVFNQQRNEFEFRPGPVFANLLLVDEVNRASPKTHAALLECMEE